VTNEFRLIENPFSIFTSCVDVDGKRLLDVGCGDGGNLVKLKSLGANVVGVEPHLRGNNSDVEIIKSGAEELPFADDSFDIVCFFYSLHHVPADMMNRALSETHRVLKSGGKLYAIDPRPNGSLYDLSRDIDDEAAVQQQAYEALQSFITKGDFKLDWDDHFNEFYDYANYDDYVIDMINSDATRNILLDKMATEQSSLFHTLGEAVNGMMRFYLKCYACLLTKT